MHALKVFVFLLLWPSSAFSQDARVLTGHDAIAAPEVQAWFDALGSIDDIELVTEAWRADESSIPARFDGPGPHRPPMTHAEAMTLRKTPGPAVRVTRWLWVQGAIRNDREVLWSRGEAGGIISTSLSFDGDEQRIYSFQVVNGREDPIDGGMIQELSDAATGMVTPVEAIGLMADQGGTRSVLDFAASNPHAAELRRIRDGFVEFTLHACLPPDILNQKRGMASDKSVRYTLSESIGWMPVQVEYFGASPARSSKARLQDPYLVFTAHDWSATPLGDGTRVSLPGRVVHSSYDALQRGPVFSRGPNRPLIAELDWDSVAVNAGRTIDDVRVSFPPGTLVLDELRQVRYIEGQPGSEEPLRTIVPVPTPDGGTVGMVVDGPGRAGERGGGGAFSDDGAGGRGQPASGRRPAASGDGGDAAGPSDGGLSGSGWWLALGGGLVVLGGLTMFWKRGRG